MVIGSLESCCSHNFFALYGIGVNANVTICSHNFFALNSKVVNAKVKFDNDFW